MVVRLGQMALAVMGLMESALPALMAAAAAEPMEARLGAAQRAAIIVRELARVQHTAVMALTVAAVLAAAVAIITLSLRGLIMGAQDHRIWYGHKHLMARQPVLVPAAAAAVTHTAE